MPSFRTLLAALAVAGVTAACADALGVRDVAGTYTLRMVDDTPVPPQVDAPTITLTTPSMAARRSRYRTCAMGEVREVVALGTFHIRGTTLELALRRVDDVWRPPAELVGETITLRHPHPAGGRDIVEVYERR